MEQQNNEYHELLNKNLSLLSSYPVSCYNHLLDEKKELEKKNKTYKSELKDFKESNKNLRQKHFQLRDEINRLKAKQLGVPNKILQFNR